MLKKTALFLRDGFPKPLNELIKPQMIPGRPPINLDKDELKQKDNNIERKKDREKKHFEKRCQDNVIF